MHTLKVINCGFITSTGIDNYLEPSQEEEKLKIFRLNLNFYTRCRKRASAHETTFFYTDKGEDVHYHHRPASAYQRGFAKFPPNFHTFLYKKKEAH